MHMNGDPQDGGQSQEVVPNSQAVIDGLGEHFHAQVANHVRNHQESNAQSEKQHKLDSLKDRLRAVAEATKVGSETQSFKVAQLHEGPLVTASLRVMGEGGDLSRVAAELTGIDPTVNAPNARHYLESGPLSADPEYLDQRLDSPSSIASAYYGIGITMHLESPHDYGDGKTHDEVLTGIIIDPESIVVPQLEDDGRGGQTEFYRVIGPDDSRFTPIMTVLDHVAQQVANSQPQQ